MISGNSWNGLGPPAFEKLSDEPNLAGIYNFRREGSATVPTLRRIRAIVAQRLDPMRFSRQLATVAASLSLMCGAAANADTILKYTFSPGTYYNFQGGAADSVSGTFTYDVTTETVTSADYTRGSDHFTTGSLYSPGDTKQVYFGVFGTANYDVYQLNSSLNSGGTDTIASGTHPSIVIDAGGSVVAGAVPEPTSWALMLMGLGLVGYAARGRKSVVLVETAH